MTMTEELDILIANNPNFIDSCIDGYKEITTEELIEDLNASMNDCLCSIEKLKAEINMYDMYDLINRAEVKQYINYGIEMIKQEVNSLYKG